jgi:hypothetical protein
VVVWGCRWVSGGVGIWRVQTRGARIGLRGVLVGGRGYGGRMEGLQGAKFIAIVEVCWVIDVEVEWNGKRKSWWKCLVMSLPSRQCD